VDESIAIAIQRLTQGSTLRVSQATKDGKGRFWLPKPCNLVNKGPPVDYGLELVEIVSGGQVLTIIQFLWLSLK